jgi:hypothetical protein
MNEYEIEVIHTPTGEYFTMTRFYDDDHNEGSVFDDILNNLSVNVRKVY